jgi:hypothetical protein
MSQTDEKAKTTEEAEPEGTRCCPDVCRQMMSGGLPDSCATQMRELLSRGLPENCKTKAAEMMSRFFATTQRAESKPKEAV